MPELKPLVAVIMGSKSDWDTMRRAVETLDELGVPNEARVLSAHRTPDATAEFARNGAARGLRVVIAGAGGAAHLAGVIAAHTWLPVLGVPIQSKLQGLDSLLSTAQMPGGIPVGTLAIGKPEPKTLRCLPPPFWPLLTKRFGKNWKRFARNKAKTCSPRNWKGEDGDFGGDPGSPLVASACYRSQRTGGPGHNCGSRTAPQRRCGRAPNR